MAPKTPLVSIEQEFTSIGATFVAPFGEFQQKLSSIKAFLFDWDGVFNDGIKFADQGSAFSEPDSMGTNLLRLGYWMCNAKNLPQMGILTGARNPVAKRLAKREHFHQVYSGVKYKPKALDHFCDHWGLHPHEVAYAFDDVNDLKVASLCGLRFMVARKASPMMKAYALTHQLTDYYTAHSGGQYAVREICELILACWGVYENVVETRVNFGPTYLEYLNQRNEFIPAFFEWKNETLKMTVD